MSLPTKIDSTSLEGTPLCGAKLRNRDARCRQPAGNRTPHPGNGRCWLHGGLTPVKSGRYSTVVRREITDIINKLEEDPDPLNILPDLIMVRALLVDFLNRYEENRDAVLAWYASWNGRPWKVEDLKLLGEVLDLYEGELKQQGVWEGEDEGPEASMCARAQAMVANMEAAYSSRPREVLDIADGYRMAAEATKIVERIEKIRARGAISAADFARVMTEVGRTAEAALSPARLRTVLASAGVDMSTIPEMALMEAADALRNQLTDLWMSIRVV